MCSRRWAERTAWSCGDGGTESGTATGGGGGGESGGGGGDDASPGSPGLGSVLAQSTVVDAPKRVDTPPGGVGLFGTPAALPGSALRPGTTSASGTPRSSSLFDDEPAATAPSPAPAAVRSGGLFGEDEKARQADALFAEGKRFNEAGDAWTANELFQHAYVASPRTALLLSIGNMQLKLHQPELAALIYRRVEVQPPTLEPAASRRRSFPPPPESISADRVSRVRVATVAAGRCGRGRASQCSGARRGTHARLPSGSGSGSAGPALLVAACRFADSNEWTVVAPRSQASNF